MLSTVDLVFPRLTNMYNPFEIPLSKYFESIKLSIEKKNDLKKMCEELYIPIECHYFFKNILNVNININIRN